MITKPKLLLDEKKCRENIFRMANKALKSNVRFRPHFKTHQSAEVGLWFMDSGINSITVSSVTMAKYFANHGWKDILIAFPFNILETNEINELPIMTKVQLTVESVETARYLSKHIEKNISVYIKIDTGYNRTGIEAGNFNKIDEVLHEIENSNNLNFSGFLSHFGNTYSAKSTGEVRYIYQESVKKLKNLKSIYHVKYPNLILSIGDTPSCSLMDHFDGIDEIRPGNFVFYDLMQYQLGACSMDEIAVVLACPVSSIHPDRNEVVIYGGAVHLSKEYLNMNKGEKNYGFVVKLNDLDWDQPLSNTYVCRLSQEHGIIKTSKNLIEQFQMGDLLGVIPVHSCLTANLADGYLTTQNNILHKLRSLPIRL